MKLISMTDFVLTKNEFKLYKYSRGRIQSYAQFLKLPLTLGMFVPCDDNGSVLEKPLHIELYEGSTYDLDCKIYKEAQSKVIFDTNRENDKHIIYFKSKETYQRVEYNTLTDRFFFGLKTIEDCIHLHLDLAVSF